MWIITDGAPCAAARLRCCCRARCCCCLQLRTSDLDEANISELRRFDAAVALEILDHYCAGDLSAVRNRRAYLAGGRRGAARGRMAAVWEVTRGRVRFCARRVAGQPCTSASRAGGTGVQQH